MAYSLSGVVLLVIRPNQVQRLSSCRPTDNSQKVVVGGHFPKASCPRTKDRIRFYLGKLCINMEVSFIITWISGGTSLCMYSWETCLYIDCMFKNGGKSSPQEEILVLEWGYNEDSSWRGQYIESSRLLWPASEVRARSAPWCYKSSWAYPWKELRHSSMSRLA